MSTQEPTIEYHGKTREDYVSWVVEGIRTMEHVLRIDVFNSSVSVTYDPETNPTDLIQTHELIREHGLSVFISNNAKKNGQRVSYQLDNNE